MFNENIGLTTICKHRRLLSIISVLTKNLGKNINTEKDRHNWCLANIDNDFENWVFVDETSVWINEVPLYHHRHSDSQLGSPLV